jgi:hypothetical protein
VDFEAVGSTRGVPFGEARQAYKDAARKHHLDAGGEPEVMKRINYVWDRIRRSYSCTKKTDRSIPESTSDLILNAILCIYYIP